jgi:6-phosphogluconolactonase/glucosamine-6-phosphate isomerase/deaminase
MKFVREGREAAAKAVSERITTELAAGRFVLWLVCGGSNIETETEIMDRLRQSGQHIDALTILPMDERYGPAGHPDSNYRQLRERGFDPGTASWYDVLEKNLSLADTVQYYTHLMEHAFATRGTVVGVFGMGDDGHTAGIKPNSPAVIETAASVVGYDSPPFVRLTLTPQELVKTNYAFVLAYGDEKAEALKRLQAHSEPLEKLPAGLLYDIPEVYIYNDQIGDTV